jgi:WD40 repeat protein
MAGSSNQSTRSARVFLSYARADGEDFARKLREDLEAAGIPCWMDRFGMEGGHDWWLQIVEALNQVEFMVLVMTPAAIQSPNVRDEWRYARQQGVCIYPVKAAPKLDYSSLPRWMHKVHWYTLEHEWTKFVNDLNTRCQQIRVPFMVKDLPADFVERPKEFEQLISRLLDEKHEEPVAITAALQGAGGYGKTTMAMALCHDKRIREGFDDGILWVTLGENPGNLIGKIEDLIYMLSREQHNFTGLDAATARFAELLADRDILVVIDDVWNATDLKPFLQEGKKRCARLITTRNDVVLPADAQRIPVDAMKPDEAVQLLSVGLDGTGGSGRSANEIQALQKLAARLGEWALLLKLANGVLRERVGKYHQTLLDALAYINKALDRRGLTFFDAKDTQDRNQAVAKTLGVSFELLSADEYARYKELAVFPEDIDIPLATIQKLWGATGELDDFDTEALCERLHGLSLLLDFDLSTHKIRLHDVVRAYLRQEGGMAGITALDGQLLDAYRLKRWAELPHDEPYLWDYLADHLIGAGRAEELVATVKDLRYLATKTLVRNASAAERDLNAGEKEAPNDVPLQLLKRNFASMNHLLNRCKKLPEVEAILHSRLVHLNELSDLCQVLEAELTRPYLTSWHSLPDLPHPALIRTLQGHTSWVNGCAVSPRGDYIVSASNDRTLKVWDARTGAVRFTLEGHTGPVRGCAVSPQGDFIVSASDDWTLKVWDARTGAVRFTLEGHTDWVRGCAVSPQADFIVSASHDWTLKVWDSRTGAVRFTLEGHTSRVRGCAVSPQGDFIVSASHDWTLKVWDAHTGAVHFTLEGHTGLVNGCAVSPQGDFIVSASSDRTLKVWDSRTGALRFTLEGHTDSVNGCAVSPQGDFIVSASWDQTLKVWDARTGAVRFTLEGHTDSVRGCAVSSQGDFIVSASWDQTLKLWSAQTGECLSTLLVDGTLLSCAFHPDGEHIVAGGAVGSLYFLRLVR